MQKRTKELLEKCLRAAKDAGVPKEQARQLTEHGAIPLPWQWRFHAIARQADNENGPVEIGVGGARGPGKTHTIFTQAAVDDCQRVGGLKVLFLRKTAISAKESFEDLIIKILKNKIQHEKVSNTINFPNGSKILLGGFHNENDIDKYIGIEYDLIVIEELNQLTEEKYKKLQGSLRTSKLDWRPRIYTSFNPGGIGHDFVKTHFVIPFRMREEKETRYVPATYRDNPFLNREYVEYLEGLEGDLGKAWREGDFDLFAGQFFKEWRYDIHVCDPFPIPQEWRKFKAGDAGYVQPSIGWYAVSPDNQLFRYKELYKQNLSASQLADETVAMTNQDEVIEYEAWDPAFWAKKGERDDTLSGAEVYAERIKELTKKYPHLVKAPNDRIPGWAVVREYLRPFPREGELTAKLQIFSTCVNAIRTIPALQHDERHPEDVDTDLEDHIIDEVRYAVMSRPTPAMTQKELERVAWERAMKKQREHRGGKPLFIR